MFHETFVLVEWYVVLAVVVVVAGGRVLRFLATHRVDPSTLSLETALIQFDEAPLQP